MVLSIHPEIYLEAFLVLLERLFILVLRFVAYNNIMVRAGHAGMVAAEHQQQDSEAFLVLN